MKQKLLFVIFFSLLLNLVYPQRTCKMKEHMQKRMQKPVYKERYERLQRQFNDQLKLYKKYKNASVNRYIIPVAVHFPAGNEADRICLETLAQNQIDILNKDFKGTNSDIVEWNSSKSHYTGINTGSVDIEFQIATTDHPDNTDPELKEGGPAVTIGYNFGNGGDSDFKWAGYLNFLIKEIDGLGYSSLGGDPNIGDTVVMNINAFGSGNGCNGYIPEAPYNLGRTVTHEVGHHFNLDHTWGDGGCSSDDGISDTPNIDESSGGCPAAGSIIMCDNKSLTMNYMDYVDDACMYMFTAGQAQRVSAYLNTIIANYKSSVLAVEDLATREFKIYPNPAKDKIEISFKRPLGEEVTISILDILGKTIKVRKNNGVDLIESIDLKGLKTGVYFLSISSGKNRVTRKIVKI